MTNDIEKYYLVYDTCMKLKERGFNVWCDKLYTPYPHYKGEPLGSDEEYELKAEGKGRSIRYKIIDQNFTNRNSEQYNEKSCSCPEINIVLDWILENWHIHIIVKPYWYNDKMVWFCDVFYLRDGFTQLMNTIIKCEHKYKAYADGIRWVLDNYKVL